MDVFIDGAVKLTITPKRISGRDPASNYLDIEVELEGGNKHTISIQYNRLHELQFAIEEFRSYTENELTSTDYERTQDLEYPDYYYQQPHGDKY